MDTSPGRTSPVLCPGFILGFCESLMYKLNFRAVLFLILFCESSVLAKDPPLQRIDPVDAFAVQSRVLDWPPLGAPVVRFTFGKFKGLGPAGEQRNYTVEIRVENLWDQTISEAQFFLYLFDKNKVRIGEAWISISNSAPGEIIRFETNVQTSGVPTSMTIAPRTLPPELRSYLPAKKISVTVNSVPQGAEIKVDGVDAGTTPKMIEVGPGKHAIEFSKTGFNTGKFPLEIGPDD